MLDNSMNNSIQKNIPNFNKYFFFYLLFLGSCGIIFLYSKYDVANDSTISEWLINYQGGFTRRGLIGEICFQFALFFDSGLREVIFSFQALTYLIFLSLTYKFFRDLKVNRIILFSIFTPIFILYPVAEIEVLARKELFLYIYFLIFLFISSPISKLHKFIDTYIFLITPIVCLIYEEVILFFPFIVACLVIQRQIKTIKLFLNSCLLFLPSILIVLFFFLFPLSVENHQVMKQSLLLNFNENCYMSCRLLTVNDINQFSTIIDFMYGKRTSIEIISYIIRYFLIILIGFLPLFILSRHSKFNNSNIFSNFKLNNILLLLLFLFIPLIPLFVFGYDWGRWVGMMVTFSTFFYFHLYKSNLITVDFDGISKKFIFFENKKKIYYFNFYYFCFWLEPKNCYEW